MTSSEINQKLVELHEQRPSNCTGVLYTKKTVNGVMTDEWSFTYLVNEKKPQSELDEKDIIPKVISIDNGDTIKTDVIVGENKFAALQNCPCDFYYWTSSFCSSQTQPQPQRDYIRPIVGGLQISNPVFNIGLSYTYGTMGFIAVDSNDNSLVGVTNNHVIIQDAFRTDQWNSSSVDRSSANQLVGQPYLFSDNITITGAVKRYVPMLKAGTGLNYVDGALLTIDQSVMSSSETYKQYGFTGFTYPLPFATTQEIDDLIFNNWDMFSVGATTGIKGEGASKLKFAGYATISLSNDLQDTTFNSTFADCIAIVATASTITPGNTCWDPIYQGDSGSALVANINGTYKIVGLVFAGSFTIDVINGSNYLRCTIGYANRIDKVAELLEISPYTGQTINFSNRNSPEIVYVSGQSSQNSITQNGKKYWQVGLSNV